MASTFFVDGQGCVTSLFLTCGKTMVEIMKIMETSFKRSHALSAPKMEKPYIVSKNKIMS